MDGLGGVLEASWAVLEFQKSMESDPGGGPVAGAQGPLLRILQDFLGCYYVYPERKEVGWIEEGKES